MAYNPQAPATKQDVSLIMESMSNIYMEIKKSEKRTKHYFDVVAEKIHHDAIGANRDELELVKDRVKRLEDYTGLVKA